jgi:hypothetical protein
MGVSDQAKNVIPLKLLRKITNKNFSPLVNSIRGHSVYNYKDNATQSQSESEDQNMFDEIIELLMRIICDLRFNIG